MALATNTTLGTIVLSGDFYGSTPAAPSLTPSGVSPGQTTNFYSQVIDAKGRTIYRSNYSLPADKDTINTMLGAWDIATKFAKGFVQVGDNIDVAGGVISLPVATDTIPGVVKVGVGLEIDVNDKVNVVLASQTVKGIAQPDNSFDLSAGTISVPVAGYSNLGSIQPSSDFTISNGTLSYSLPPCTDLTLGNAIIGSNIINNSGTISLATGSDLIPGLLQVGSGFSFSNNTISLNNATYLSSGLVQIGSNFNLSSGVISLLNTSTSNFGVIQPGTNFSITSNTLDFNIPIATNSSVGGVIVGSGLAVDSFGSLSITYATKTIKGIVQIGSNINATAGLISVNDASNLVKGVVQIGSGFTLTNNTISLSDATDTSFGIASISTGNGLNVSGGTISSSVASDAAFGMVKIGSNLTISGGVLSYEPSNLTKATTSTLGHIMVGSGLSMTGASSDTLAIPYATNSSYGRIIASTKFIRSSNVLQMRDYGIGFTSTSYGVATQSQINLNFGNCCINETSDQHFLVYSGSTGTIDIPFFGYATVSNGWNSILESGQYKIYKLIITANSAWGGSNVTTTVILKDSSFFSGIDSTKLATRVQNKARVDLGTDSSYTLNSSNMYTVMLTIQVMRLSDGSIKFVDLSECSTMFF